MIVSSPDEFEVGQVLAGGIVDYQNVYHEQPALVLRRATLSEWVAEAEADGVSASGIGLTVAQAPGLYFYEVSID